MASKQNVLTPSKPTWLSAERSALCIVDVQHDFASPKGLLGQYGVDMSRLAPAISNINSLVEDAHRIGLPVVFIGLQTSPETDSEAWSEWMARQGKDSTSEQAICRRGTQGEAFYQCMPTPSDKVVLKTRYSAFWQTDLNSWLKTQGIDTLVVTGITTECCVESTVRDAFHHDYHVFVVSDACAAYEDELHQASLRSMALSFALLTDTQSVHAIWGTQ
ncbi:MULTISPECIES: cysteine hydrolase family protein [Alteromonas]|uniref:Isochorismatase n=2 Tax=Alteromonas australica TaxID=589873 RepID=A0A358E4Q9_9ALTE|nr:MULTISPECIES: cysteine hydrolase [Alteromonas]MBU32408.1 isochorismatase [Alteromonas sp.]QPL49924.1 cysteine hydrolase [Alteromonas sp. B31-7]HAI72580.1 isochorismatase [Alteromonas australica]HBU53132.1 isochorismatase [Alteromonas australica]|tara:strand:- start:9739 stop:10392 length:654 start_codon:yes stop_codon:yes gene_type:complete